ncbi:MAG: diacylglycerol/lipid kinase family protein [Streptosporangiaceae bacterium]
MRALLIVNPHATSTTRLRRDVIASALASAVELEVVETRYRGHATSLAGAACSRGYGLVITLGGDGTVNEAINGIMSTGAGADGPAPAVKLPALAALPGGSANVFSRALGLPADPVDAAGQILQALAEDRSRAIGLGMAGRRYFAFNAGLGMDAEVVRAVEGRRAHGKVVTPALYLRMALRQYYRVTDRQRPALRLELDGRAADSPLFLAIVSNTAPWTYLGKRPVHANPQAGFDSGLDLFSLRRLRTVSTLGALRQMLSSSGQPPHGRSVLTVHDQARLTLTADRPVAFQVDGEYVGEAEEVTFRSVPLALRIMA